MTVHLGEAGTRGEFRNTRIEPFWAERFCHKVVRSEVERLRALLLVTSRGENDARHGLPPRVAAHAGQHLESAQSGHHEVQEHQRNVGVFLQRMQRAGSIPNKRHLERALLKLCLDDPTNVRLVIRDKDMNGHTRHGEWVQGLLAAATPSRFRKAPTRSRIVGMHVPSEAVEPAAKTGGRLPKCTLQKSEVKLVIRLKLGHFTGTLRLRPMPPISHPIVVRLSPRLGLFVATLALVLGVAACEDPLTDAATYENAEQIFAIGALTGGDVTTPAGLSLATRQIVRIDGVFDFDLAFDINSSGKPVILPMGFVGTPVTGSRTIGLYRATSLFGDVSEAPRNGYVFDSTMTFNPGAAIIVLSQQSGCTYSLTPQTYAKITIDSVSVPRRMLYGRALINLNCGKRQLTPGLPKF